MTIWFTESKEDSNLFFKVECRRPVMLLLYVDDLFLTEKRNSFKLQEGSLLLSSRWRTWVWYATFEAWRCGRIRMESPWDKGSMQWISWRGLGWWTARPWPHLWHRTWSYWMLLHQSRLMPRCIIRRVVPWCTQRIHDQIFSLLWTHWYMFTCWLQSMQWGS